jgi:hypothetical protein
MLQPTHVGACVFDAISMLESALLVAKIRSGLQLSCIPRRRGHLIGCGIARHTAAHWIALSVPQTL